MPVSEGRGFSIALNRSDIATLIQVAGSHQARCVYEVRSVWGIAHLFFERGHIAHAECSELTGLRAVVELLRWNEGTAEEVEFPWPAKCLLRQSPGELLLRAAACLDELAVDSAPASSGLRATNRKTARPPRMLPRCPRVPAIELPGASEDDPLRLRGVSLDSLGCIARQWGKPEPALADMAYFSMQALESIGAHLGLVAGSVLHFQGTSQDLLLTLGRSATCVQGSPDRIENLAHRLGAAA